MLEEEEQKRRDRELERQMWAEEVAQAEGTENLPEFMRPVDLTKYAEKWRMQQFPPFKARGVPETT